MRTFAFGLALSLFLWAAAPAGAQQGTSSIGGKVTDQGGGVLPGVAITLAPGQFPTTVEFKVCFLRPVRLGTVIGRARIVHRGEAMVFAEGDLRDPDNRLLATATATLRIVTIPNVELDFGQGAAERQL